jgi:hypothetical protein
MSLWGGLALWPVISPRARSVDGAEAGRLLSYNDRTLSTLILAYI